MTEHKFTDDEIIRAVNDAKYRVDGIVARGYYLTPETLNAVVDLIKRYKAENEELTTLCDVQDKNMLEQMAEIERLQKKAIMVEAIENSINPLPFETDYDKAIKEAKSEAIKEFAESIKLEFYREFDEIIPSIMADRIDNLVKEMTGDATELTKVSSGDICVVCGDQVPEGRQVCYMCENSQEFLNKKKE